MVKDRPVRAGLILLLALLLGACVRDGGTVVGGGEIDQGAKLQVVATTTLVGDTVQQVGGDGIQLTVLLPVGVDPHGFDPAPADIAAVADADVVFLNGLGLETFLEPLLENAGGQARVVTVSDGIQTAAHDHGEDDDHDYAATDEHSQDLDHGHEEGDPHVWTDPINVTIWAQNIARALGELDPAGAQVYQANALVYQQQLAELDAWVREEVSRIPQEQRQLVTDHAMFGYFAGRYGFEQVGTIVPGYNSLAEPSARDLAALESAIRDLGVKAVFVGNTVSPGLAERVAADTDTQLVFLYTGSLGEPGGEASTYLDYTRHNVSAIVQALR